MLRFDKLDLAQLADAAAVTNCVRALYGARQPAPPGVRRTLHLADDQSIAVEAGNINAAATRAYLNGQCHALAFALNLRTGFPVIYVGDVECWEDQDRAACRELQGEHAWCGCQVSHLGVLSPDNYFVDVFGPSEQLEHALLYAPSPPDAEATVHVLPPAAFDWILRSNAWREPDLEVALTFADRLLAISSNRFAFIA